MVPPDVCISNSPWDGPKPLMGTLSPKVAQMLTLTVSSKENVLFPDWITEYHADLYWSSAALQQDEPIIGSLAACILSYTSDKHISRGNMRSSTISITMNLWPNLLTHWSPYAGVSKFKPPNISPPSLEGNW